MAKETEMQTAAG